MFKLGRQPGDRADAQDVNLRWERSGTQVKGVMLHGERAPIAALVGDRGRSCGSVGSGAPRFELSLLRWTRTGSAGGGPCDQDSRRCSCTHERRQVGYAPAKDRACMLVQMESWPLRSPLIEIRAVPAWLEAIGSNVEAFLS